MSALASQSHGDVVSIMQDLGAAAKAAARVLATAPSAQKNLALTSAAEHLKYTRLPIVQLRLYAGSTTG